jgi:hypothetical protein
VTRTSGERRPRFRRTRTRPFLVTERDLAIIELVYRYRLLNSEHLASLVKGSSQVIRRRLQLLYHARYLDRPRIQIADFYRNSKPEPMVYALGNKGADLLAEHLGLPRRTIDWTAKNRKIRDTFFRHTLMVAGILVAFEVSCRRHGNVRLIPWEEILAKKCPPETRKRKRPESWRVRIPGRGDHGVTPDAIFGLHYLDRLEGRNHSYFFLEADRGTMPVKRRTLAQTAILKKLLLYHATAVQKLHTRRFDFKAFRVLTVTASPDRERVASMIRATQELDSLERIFLFTDEASLLSGEALSHEWLNGKKEQVVLGSRKRDLTTEPGG